ncbi:autotransporter outer membrane beta-barrel domain-containing protein [Escherichia coli]|nr:autotransporter outer membrane beta-barrel domain-containing protein [Escherichia coli]
MNSEGKPGDVLTVNGNYTGNNGLMTFNATLQAAINSPTDKMNVKAIPKGTLAFGLITLAASVHKRSTVLNSLRLA